jgi:benzoate membrane transport protein
MRPSIVISALVAALVGFGGTVAVVLAAAQALAATPAQTASWLTALCLSIAATSALLSIRHRIPVITAWSTAGSALVAATAGTVTIEAAVAAFILSGALVLLTGAFRPIGALIERIPTSVAAAMLAGVLVPFVMAIFQHAGQSPIFVLPLVAIFLLVRLISPAGAVLVTLLAGLALVFVLGLAPDLAFDPAAPQIVFIRPSFEPGVLIGLGVPLYLVTMASQNLPGMAVLRAYGYPAPARSVLTVTGIASILSAPFGAHITNAAAITASICAGPEAHPDPQKRWLTGPAYGVAYLLLAVCAASSVALIAAMPPAFIATVAGLALLAPLMNALAGAVAVPEQRLAATMTFAVTASGLSLFGIGSAFWGLLAGLLVLGLDLAARPYRSREQHVPTDPAPSRQLL